MSKYEDYKRAIKNIDDLLQTINSNDDMVKYHYYVKAVDMSRLNQLVEKEKPKSSLYINRNLDDLSPVTTSQCRVTGKSIYTEFDYCPHCGQKLDWSE